MRILAIFTASFAAAVFAAQYAVPEAAWLPAAMGCLLMVFALPLLRGKLRLLLPLAAWGLAVGFAFFWGYAALVRAPAEALAGTERRVSMTVCEDPTATEYGAKVTVRLDCLPHGKAVYYGDEALLAAKPGERITGRVQLESASRIREDEVTTFTSRGVFLLAYRRSGIEIEPGTAGAFRWLPLRLGRAMAKRTAALFPGETAAFLAAVLTGDKSGLSEQAKIALSQAGIYHIMAVSGMHCAILLGCLQLLLGRNHRRLLAGMGIPLLAFYALLTGCSPSVVRACVMLSFLLAAPLFDRERDAPTAMAAALLLILLQNPYATASISLQLSFGAVAGLLWLSPRMQRLLLGEKPRNGAVRFLAASLSASCGALVFTAPLSLWYFGNLSLVAPLSNLVCLWAVELLFGGGLLALLASWMYFPLGRLLAVVPGLLARYLLWAARHLAALPYHALYRENPFLVPWLIFAYGLLALCVWKRPRRRTWGLAALCAVLTLTAVVQLGKQSLTAHDLDVTVLDVGQGSCTLLESEGLSALIDCGSSNSWYSAGDLAANRLLTMGCRRLDFLVLTHFDTDHTDGVTALLERIKVRRLLVPASEAEEDVVREAASRGTEVFVLTEQTSYSLGKGTLTVHPPVGEGSSNESGLSVLAQCGTFSLLVTGDMDGATEEKLLAEWPLPALDALVVGHHGSDTSTSQALLAALTPETAIVSVGSNSYGHPSKKVLARLKASGAEVYRTDLQGSVHLGINEGAEHGIREKGPQGE